MTKSDKIEIDSLVRQVEELKSAADKASAKYVDAKTFSYAQQALDDFEDNKRKILTVLNDNAKTLYPPENTYIDGYGGTPCGARFDGTRRMRLRLDYGPFYADAMVTGARCVGTSRFSYEALHFIEVGLDRRVPIDDPRDRVILASDLSTAKGLLRSQTVGGWVSVRRLADSTRAKNALMVDEFKKGLRHFVDEARKNLNTIERNAESMKNLKPYVKVELGEEA